MTWLSIDGGNEAKTGHACYVAYWGVSMLYGVESSTIAGASALAQARCAPPVEYVVVERTQADGRLARGTTTPAVMVGLAWNTAAVAYALARGAPVHEYTPNDWIGQTNKAILHRNIWAALEPAERENVARFGRAASGRARGPKNSGRPVDVLGAILINCKRAARGQDPLKHDWYNVLDAAGVGLFHIGRVGKGAAPIRQPR